MLICFVFALEKVQRGEACLSNGRPDKVGYVGDSGTPYSLCLASWIVRKNMS